MRCRLQDELQRSTPAIVAEGVLSDHDCARIANQAWPDTSYDLPDDGSLVAGLNTLALGSLADAVGASRGWLAWARARRLLDAVGADTVLAAGIALGILEEDLERAEIGFVSPLLRAYFAGRGLLHAFNTGELPTALRPDVQHRATSSSPVDRATVLQRRDHGLAKVADYVALAPSEPDLPRSVSPWRCVVLMSALLAPDPGAFLAAAARAHPRSAMYCATHPWLRRRLEPGFVRRLSDALTVEAVDAFAGRDATRTGNGAPG